MKSSLKTDCRKSSVRYRCAERLAIKKVVRVADKRQAVSYLQEAHEMPERHACELVGIARSTRRYQAIVKEDEAELTQVIREYAIVIHSTATASSQAYCKRMAPG